MLWVRMQCSEGSYIRMMCLAAFGASPCCSQGLLAQLSLGVSFSSLFSLGPPCLLSTLINH